jgi:hypothetical protein
MSNFIQNQSTWLTVYSPTCRNNLHNNNDILYPQDASWSYRLWFGVDNVFSIRCRWAEQLVHISLRPRFLLTDNYLHFSWILIGRRAGYIMHITAHGLYFPYRTGLVKYNIKYFCIVFFILVIDNCLNYNRQEIARACCGNKNYFRYTQKR